jgi:hypothetical protein
MLIFRPESWAEAARYRSKVTIIPLLLAILLAGVLIGLGESSRGLKAMKAFAAGYDAHYPPLQLTSEGTLRAMRDLPEPIRFDGGGGGVLLVDPTGKTSAESLKTGPTIFISDKDVWLVTGSESPPFHIGQLALFTRSSDAFASPLPNTLTPASAPAAPATTGPAIGAAPAPAALTINSQSLTEYLNRNAFAHILFGTIIVVFAYGMINTVWAVLMMLLICPLVLLGAAGPKIGEGPDRRLILPRRAAYRMSAAVLVPLIVFGGVLHAVGKPVIALLGFEGSTLFWFFSAAALAVWAGILAKRLYSPSEAPRRAT